MVYVLIIAALALLPDSIFKILLSHAPSHWRRNVLSETDIQLTLSGHTHAMQLKVGSFLFAKWKYPEWRVSRGWKNASRQHRRGK